MALRRLLGCLALVVCCGAAGCGSDDGSEAPALDQPALLLHTCLSLEPEHDGPCTDEALATCPSDVTRNNCLATALDQLEAVESEQFGSSNVEDDDPPTLLIVVIVAPLTVALLAGLSWRTSRRTSQADEAEFASGLPALEQSGFTTMDPADARTLPIAVRGKVVHLLRHSGPTPVWLIETSNRTLGVNKLGVLRQALLLPQGPLPAGGMAPTPDTHHRYAGTWCRIQWRQAWSTLSTLASHMWSCGPTAGSWRSPSSTRFGWYEVLGRRSRSTSSQQLHSRLRRHSVDGSLQVALAALGRSPQVDLDPPMTCTYLARSEGLEPPTF